MDNENTFLNGLSTGWVTKMVNEDPDNVLQDIAIDFWLVWLFVFGQIIFFVSGAVDSSYQLWYLIAGSALVAVVLRFHRRRTKWVWPGTSRRGVQMAVTSLITGFILLVAVRLWSSSLNARVFAWGTGIGLIVLCKVLHALNVIYFLKRKYALACTAQIRAVAVAATGKSQPVQSDDDLLTRFSRIYSTVTVVIFLMFFLYSGAVLGNSSLEPTDVQFAPIEYHSRVYYVTPLQKTLLILLEAGSIVGIPSSIVFRIAAYLVEGRKKNKADKDNDSVW